LHYFTAKPMDNDPLKEAHNSLIINYLTLRKAIGLLGILLPVVLLMSSVFRNAPLEISISHYYHSPMRDFFIGVMCSVGLFLFCYNGYKKTKDGLASRIAGLLAFGVAFLPTTFKDPARPCNPGFEGDATGILHLACAALFFLTLALISLFLFTKTDGLITPQKRIRNRIYKVCGIAMILCLVLMVLYFAIPGIKCEYQSMKPVFFLEAFGLFFFGASWLIKGETLFKDKPGER
jgi:hypothetical protein